MEAVLCALDQWKSIGQIENCIAGVFWPANQRQKGNIKYFQICSCFPPPSQYVLTASPVKDDFETELDSKKHKLQVFEERIADQERALALKTEECSQIKALAKLLTVARRRDGGKVRNSLGVAFFFVLGSPTGSSNFGIADRFPPD